MRLIPVESSMIYAVGYDDAHQEMEVFFHEDGVYRYKNIDKQTFEELLRAKSKGRFMHEHIFERHPDYKVR